MDDFDEAVFRFRGLYSTEEEGVLMSIDGKVVAERLIIFRKNFKADSETYCKA